MTTSRTDPWNESLEASCSKLVKNINVINWINYFQREGVAQGKTKRSSHGLRSQFCLSVLKNLARYSLPLEELNKYLAAYKARQDLLKRNMKWKKEDGKFSIGNGKGGKGLRIAIRQIEEAISKA